MYCRHYHWDLLSLHSQQEQDELEQLLSSLPFTLTDYIWLGLRRSLRGNDWFWMSGHTMNFFHWPQNSVPYYYSNTCGGMGSREDFQWKDIHCGEQLNFICQLGWAYTTVIHPAIYCTQHIANANCNMYKAGSSHLIGGNLSANCCSLTWTDCSHSKRD